MKKVQNKVMYRGENSDKSNRKLRQLLPSLVYPKEFITSSGFVKFSNF